MEHTVCSAFLLVLVFVFKLVFVLVFVFVCFVFSLLTTTVWWPVKGAGADARKDKEGGARKDNLVRTETAKALQNPAQHLSHLFIF